MGTDSRILKGGKKIELIFLDVNKQKEDFKMNKQVKSNLAEWLDDRKNIMESFNNPADEVFYKGAIEALARAGFEVIIKDEKHIIL